MSDKPARRRTTLPSTPQGDFGAVLAQNMKKIESVLPKHMDATRLCRMAMNAVQSNPKLMECTPASFLVSVINCAEMGLEPNLDQVALVPYSRVVTCQPMYQGLIDLAYRSGMVSDIDAELVCKGDEFQYVKGLCPVLHHVPVDAPDHETYHHVYAVAHLTTGGARFVVLSKEQIRKVRDASAGWRAYKKHGAETTWATNEPAMALKTAVKRLTKLLPKSIELRRVLALDTALDTGTAQRPESDVTDVTLDGKRVEQADLFGDSTPVIPPGEDDPHDPLPIE